MERIDENWLWNGYEEVFEKAWIKWKNKILRELRSTGTGGRSVTRTTVFKCDLCEETDESVQPSWWKVSSMRELPCPDGTHPRDHDSYKVFHICNKCGKKAGFDDLPGV